MCTVLNFDLYKCLNINTFVNMCILVRRFQDHIYAFKEESLDIYLAEMYQVQHYLTQIVQL